MNLFDALSGHVRRLPHIRRFSSFPVIRGESVPEHSWWVGFLSLLIASDLRDSGVALVNVEDLLVRALVHDLDECMTGDLIRSFKYSSEAISDAVQQASVRSMRELLSRGYGGWARGVIQAAWENAKEDGLEGDIIRLSDLLSVVIYCAEERAMGNARLDPVLKECCDKWLFPMRGHPQLGKYVDQVFPTGQYTDVFRLNPQVVFHSLNPAARPIMEVHE